MAKAAKRNIAAILIIAFAFFAAAFMFSAHSSAYAFEENASGITVTVSGDKISVDDENSVGREYQYWAKTTAGSTSGSIWARLKDYGESEQEQLSLDSNFEIGGYYYILVMLKNSDESIERYYVSEKVSNTKAVIESVEIDGLAAVTENNYLKAGITSIKVLANGLTESIEYSYDGKRGEAVFDDGKWHFLIEVTNCNDVLKLTAVGSSGSTYQNVRIIGYALLDSYTVIESVGINGLPYGESIKCGAELNFSVSVSNTGEVEDAEVAATIGGRTEILTLSGGVYTGRLTLEKMGIYLVTIQTIREGIVEDYYQAYYNYSIGERPELSLSYTTTSTDYIGTNTNYTLTITQSNESYAGKTYYQIIKHDISGEYAINSPAEFDSTANMTVNFSKEGVYRLEIRIIGENAGSFESRKYVDVYVYDGMKPVFTGELEITDLSDGTAHYYMAQTPYKVTFSGGQSSQYKFIVSSIGQWRVEEHYSPDNTFIWIPNKAGLYKISAWIISSESYGYLDSVVEQPFEVAVINLGAPQVSVVDDTVSWQAVDGATMYGIYVNGKKIDTTQSLSYQVDTTDYDDILTVAVRAAGSGGVSELSRALVRPSSFIAVSTAAQFKAMDLENNSYYLTNDIDLGDIKTALESQSTKYSIVSDGSSSHMAVGVIPKLKKHLDGNGYKVTYNYRGWGGGHTALIGILDGKVTNLSVEATVRIGNDAAVFASQAWQNTVVENCNFKVTITDDSVFSDTYAGVFRRLSGTVKDTVIEFVSTKSQPHAIAAQPAAYTVTGGIKFYPPATFKNVTVITDSARKLYYEQSSYAGVSRYASLNAAFSENAFNNFDGLYWRTVENDVGESLYFGLKGSAAIFLEKISDITINKDLQSTISVAGLIDEYVAVYGDADKATAWSVLSSAIDVAEVSLDGESINLLKAGETTLTITLPNSLNVVEILLTVTGTSVEVSHSNFDMETEESVLITATVNESSAVYVWSIENGEGVISLSPSGNTATVTAIKEGFAQVKLTVTVDDFTIDSYCNINVWDIGHIGFYAVSTSQQFRAMDLETNNYYLTNDIDLGVVTTFITAQQTTYSITPDNSSSQMTKGIIPKLTQHLDGNGFKINYEFYAAGSEFYALIGILDGKVSNLSVEASVRIGLDAAAFAHHAWQNTVIENCNFKITVTDNSVFNQIYPGVFRRLSGTVKDTTIEFISTKTEPPAIAAGPALNSIHGSNAQPETVFVNVTVKTSSTRLLYNGKMTISGITRIDI